MVTIFTLPAERVAGVTLGDDLHSFDPSGRLADLSPLRGGRFWLDIEPESHFLGNPPGGLWGNGAITGPRDPMVPVEIDVHPDAGPALFVCQNPETVLQTDRCAPGGCNCSAHRRAGGFQGLRTPFLRNPPAHRFLAQILGFPTNFLWGEKSGRKNFSQGVPRGLAPWGRRNHSFQPAH